MFANRKGMTPYIEKNLYKVNRIFLNAISYKILILRQSLAENSQPTRD